MTTSAKKPRSKKRSAASSTSKRLPNDPVFLDEGLGAHVVATALRIVGVTVHIHRDHFAPGTPDAEWLKKVGANGWIVFSKDRNIRRRTIERQALVEANVRAFILTSADLAGADMADAFIKALPRIARIANSTRAAVIATVSRGGGVTRL